MTHDEIVKMAIEAKLPHYWESGDEIVYIERVTHFAKLVALHEREACIVDIQMCIPRSGHDTPEMIFAKKVMDRIRARGNT